MEKEETKAIKKTAKEAVNPEVAAQVQAVLQQANERMQQVIAQARQLEQMLRDKTIEHMFNVLKYAHEFEPEFVEKCAGAITNYISNIAFTETAEEDAPAEKTNITQLNSNTETVTE